MLNLLDESLEEFLRSVVPLPRREIEVAFEAPDKDWAAKVAKPTINLYLWDVRRNLSERDLGIESVVGDDGQALLRPPLPRVDCRYLVTAWTSDVRDEHSLLGNTLAAILRYPELESQYLQGWYAKVEPVPSIKLGSGAGTDNSDFWSALGGQLKPGLDLTVTATVDSALLVAAGPPVDRYTVTATPRGAQPRPALVVGGRGAPPGALVSTTHGSTEAGPDGRFVLTAEVGDEIRVDGVPRGVVPESGQVELTEESGP